ncbi:hypothetical protein [Synechococcus sp. PCC 6312]|uniref:hypothetical protein n=1 Tax=Synechococcus sp. (strain ATCC 27167 / PCC 6312) TaxID=195253 RepID=UPI0012EAD8CD|nr:hypothetical protein [Synechococcus sp. PCC 6312]
MKPIKLPFLVKGTHPATNGRSYTFGDSEIEGIREYDPTLRRAPIVISHDLKGLDEAEILKNKKLSDELAFGLIEGVVLENGVLKAKSNRYVPKILDWFKEGRIAQISAKFFSPTDPQNPKPGKYYLRHVALLGVSPQAMENLPGPEFAQFNPEGEASVEIEFAVKGAGAGKKKKCQKGWSCGAGCISRTKRCPSALGSEAKSYAGYLRRQLSRIGVKNKDERQESRTEAAAFEDLIAGPGKKNSKANQKSRTAAIKQANSSEVKRAAAEYRRAERRLGRNQ